jgi:hypothetical protein
MTNLDVSIDNTHSDTREPGAPNLSKRPGLWRVVSVLAVTAALFVATLSVLQSRTDSNVTVPARDLVALESTTVTIVDLATPSGSSLAVLGLAKPASRQQVGVNDAQIDLRRGLAALVTLNDPNGNLMGLVVVPKGEDRDAVQISARSTAQALLLLAPGVLRPNLDESYVNTSVIESDPAFDKLVEAIRSDSNLSDNNELVEQAYAEIADRLPARQPAADQGCDSVIARNAYPSAGACVQPEATGLLIDNEQDRWALVFSGTEGFTDLCAVISPTNTVGAEVLIPSEQCIGNSLMVAPGPVPNQGDNQAVVEARVRSAAAVTMLYEYAGPFADLAGASAGFADESITHIRRNSADVVAALTFLIESDESFAASMDVARMSSTASDRHTAALTATRRIIEAADTTGLIPQRSAGDDAHTAILDFYVRAGERMVTPRTDWRWEVDAAGMVDFGAGS